MRLLFVTLLLASWPAWASTPIHSAPSSNSIPAGHIPPRVMREFRGAWIATVSNIDWPSKAGLPVDQQKKELRAILDKAAELRLNAVIFQVRPACDAIYASNIEPWSEFVTGKMGVAPAPFYDPLKFAVDEAHARGLELHAWFNPYRAGFAARPVSSKHISKTHPQMVRKYGKYLWLDPAEKAVQDHTTRVILDVVRRYDIDGVHMDDYFYPYPETNKLGGLLDFPDESSWAKYKKTGGKLNRSDWRRENVNKLVQRLDSEIKREKKWVTFGVSPFGIWRPGFPQQIKGFDAYDKLYADSRVWLQKGWLDYLAPQLYWQIDPPAQSYSALYNWWQEQNPQNIPIWPGGAVTRVAGKRWPANEIVRQIEIARESPAPGHIHWNISSLLQNPDNLQEKLLTRSYQGPALVPVLSESTAQPAKPRVTLKSETNGTQVVQWQLPGTGKNAPNLAGWLVQMKTGTTWQTEVVPASLAGKQFSKTNAPEVVAVSAIDRFRQTGPLAVITLR